MLMQIEAGNCYASQCCQIDNSEHRTGDWSLMTKKTTKSVAAIPVALSHEALLTKSRVYARRSLQLSNADPELCQLWASLALELLAKSALARIHPSLVVETDNPNSLLEANGIHTGTRIRTITAKVTYTRLKHTVRHFGTPAFKACDELAERRNAELHSAVAAFAAMPLATWEGDYWNAAALILSSMGLTLDEWIGADSQAPKELLRNLQHAKRESAKKRVEQAAEAIRWESEGKRRAKDQLALLIERSKAFRPSEFQDRFRYPNLDRYWEQECPACGAQGILGGDKTYDEPASDQSSADPGIEIIDLEYTPVEFYCPTCELSLEGEDALDAVDLGDVYSEEDWREIEYEPDYGND